MFIATIGYSQTTVGSGPGQAGYSIEVFDLDTLTDVESVTFTSSDVCDGACTYAFGAAVTNISGSLSWTWVIEETGKTHGTVTADDWLQTANGTITTAGDTVITHTLKFGRKARLVLTSSGTQSSSVKQRISLRAN